MSFDPENPIVSLCAQGMELEGRGEPEAAARLFLRAWQEAATPFEQFTAAHYVARHQASITDKLYWDETALQLALTLNDDAARKALPSLYLNVGKCHEDLDHPDQARESYRQALAHAALLPDDGYGRMIRRGIESGLERVGQ